MHLIFYSLIKLNNMSDEKHPATGRLHSPREWELMKMTDQHLELELQLNPRTLTKTDCKCIREAVIEAIEEQESLDTLKPIDYEKGKAHITRLVAERAEYCREQNENRSVEEERAKKLKEKKESEKKRLEEMTEGRKVKRSKEERGKEDEDETEKRTDTHELPPPPPPKEPDEGHSQMIHGGKRRTRLRKTQLAPN
jgi:hypothetical protein